MLSPVPTLRPFRAADASAVARLVTEGVRGHWTYTPEHFREAQPSTRPTRLVAEQDGVPGVQSRAFRQGEADKGLAVPCEVRGVPEAILARQGG